MSSNQIEHAIDADPPAHLEFRSPASSNHWAILAMTSHTDWEARSH